METMKDYLEMDGFTELTRAVFDDAMYADFPAEQVLDWMNTHLLPRSFAEILRRYGTDKELKEKLCKGLQEADPSAKSENIDKNVRNWLGGRSAPDDRTRLWQIAFILCKDLWAADELLASAGEYGIHWRDPEELILAFALRGNMTWAEAQQLRNRVLAEKADVQQDMPTKENKLTELYEGDFHRLGIGDEAALKEYLAKESTRMGTFHMTAYQCYNELLNQLIEDDRFGRQEKEFYWVQNKISVRRLLEMYFDEKKNRYPSEAKAKKMSLLHGALMKDWPREDHISTMSSGKQDVSRKVLILLFLASDYMISDSEYDDILTETDNDDWVFFDKYNRVNNILTYCGYRKLDPRNPFDWIVIYCMRDRDEDDRTDDEILKAVLESFFPKQTD